MRNETAVSDDNVKEETETEPQTPRPNPRPDHSPNPVQPKGPKGFRGLGLTQ